MSKRAERFLDKNLKYPMVSSIDAFLAKNNLTELLEQFNSQCLPTDEEILRNFRNITESNKGADKAIKRRQGAVWCRDFVREEPKKEKLICCGCGQDISGNAIFENHLSFHNESCIERMKHQSEFMFRKPKETLEEEINVFDTEKYWLDELLKTTERQSEILKKLIEVKSKKK
jgi:hypothetical protein